MSINFELVSPEEKLVSEPVYMAVIPAAEGEMGVGAGHTSFVVALQAGVVKLIAEKGGEERKIFIAGGFADITGENCTVLAEQAVNVGDIDQKEVEQLIADLGEDLGRAADEQERTRIRKKLDLAKLKLGAAKGEIIA